MDGATVALMTGANFPEASRVEAVRGGEGCCPDAVLTPLGWSLLTTGFDSTIGVEGDVNLCFVADVGMQETIVCPGNVFMRRKQRYVLLIVIRTMTV